MTKPSDLEWLLAKGVPVENAAARIGRSVTVVLKEVEKAKEERTERE